jgi:hypothetical protein
VYDRDSDSVNRLPRNLGQPPSQLCIVVVPAHADHSSGARFDGIKHPDLHPIAGVHHDVGGIDCGPHLLGQEPCPSRHMCIRKQKQ